MATAVQESTTAGTPWVEVLHDWTATVDHKKIGILYVLMSIVFLIIAGAEALAQIQDITVFANSAAGVAVKEIVGVDAVERETVAGVALSVSENSLIAESGIGP